MSNKQEVNLEKLAANIVYQIGDELGATVGSRQATNDELIRFVHGILSDLQEETRGENFNAKK